MEQMKGPTEVRRNLPTVTLTSITENGWKAALGIIIFCITNLLLCLGVVRYS